MHRSVPVVAVLADPYGKHGGNADGPVVGQIPIVERVMEGRAEVRIVRHEGVYIVTSLGVTNSRMIFVFCGNYNALQTEETPGQRSKRLAKEKRDEKRRLAKEAENEEQMQALAISNGSEDVDQQQQAITKERAANASAVVTKTKKNTGSATKRKTPSKTKTSTKKRKRKGPQKAAKKKSKNASPVPESEDSDGDEADDDVSTEKIDDEGSLVTTEDPVDPVRHEDHTAPAEGPEPSPPKVLPKMKVPAQRVLSEAELKAAKGSRAGITVKSDEWGCDHWGARDFFQNGMVQPCFMKAYVQEGNFLFGLRCKGTCGKTAAELDKKKCNISDGVYCYFCDEGNKPGVEPCGTFFCHSCLWPLKQKLDKEEQEKAEAKAKADGVGGRRSGRNK
jgi:hypothetical protein